MHFAFFQDMQSKFDMKRLDVEARLSWTADLLILFSLLSVVNIIYPQYSAALGYLADLDLGEVIASRQGTNIINQVKWLTLGGIASLVVVVNPKRFIELASLSWPIIALCAVALVSITWSVDPAVTMRRAIRAALPIYVLMVGIAYVKHPQRALAIVHLVFTILLLENLVGLVVPGTYDSFGNYTGTMLQKNALGILAAIAIMIGLGARTWLANPWLIRLNRAYTICWIGILGLSFSKTALALVIGVPLFLLVVNTVADIVKLNLGAVIFSIFCTILFAIGLTNVSLGMGVFDLLDLVAENITFTGRTQIWEFMLEKLDDHWLLGYGFGAFWGLGDHSPNLTAKYEYIWYLDSAHNGYLDVVASVGLLGLTVLFVLLVHFSIITEKFRTQDPRLFKMLWLFMMFLLLHNAMESSLFRGTETALWYLFLLTIMLASRFLIDLRSAEQSERVNQPKFLRKPTAAPTQL